MKQILEETSQTAKIVFLSLLIVLGTNFIFADYTEPTVAPPKCPTGSPGCDAPLNVSNEAQYKPGMLASLYFTSEQSAQFARKYANVGVGVNPGHSDLSNDNPIGTRDNLSTSLEEGSVTNPDANLYVANKTVTKDLQVTNSAGTNKILVSDEKGNAGWKSTGSGHLKTYTCGTEAARGNNLDFYEGTNLRSITGCIYSTRNTTITTLSGGNTYQNGCLAPNSNSRRLYPILYPSAGNFSASDVYGYGHGVDYDTLTAPGRYLIRFKDTECLVGSGIGANPTQAEIDDYLEDLDLNNNCFGVVGKANAYGGIAAFGAVNPGDVDIKITGNGIPNYTNLVSVAPNPLPATTKVIPALKYGGMFITRDTDSGKYNALAGKVTFFCPIQ